MKRLVNIIICVFIIFISAYVVAFAFKPDHINNATEISFATTNEYIDSYFPKNKSILTYDDNDKYVKITHYKEINKPNLSKIKFGVIFPYDYMQQNNLEKLPSVSGFFILENALINDMQSNQINVAKIDVENEDTFRLQVDFSYNVGSKIEYETLIFKFHKSIFYNL